MLYYSIVQSLCLHFKHAFLRNNRRYVLWFYNFISIWIHELNIQMCERHTNCKWITKTPCSLCLCVGRINSFRVRIVFQWFWFFRFIDILSYILPISRESDCIFDSIVHEFDWFISICIRKSVQSEIIEWRVDILCILFVIFWLILSTEVKMNICVRFANWQLCDRNINRFMQLILNLIILLNVLLEIVWMNRCLVF